MLMFMDGFWRRNVRSALLVLKTAEAFVTATLIATTLAGVR